MKINQKLWIFLILISIGLETAGALITDYNSRNISGLCIGLGAGLFSMSIVNIVFNKMYKKHPEIKRQNEISAKDERTVLIANKAKAKAYDVMILIMIVVPFLMILLNLSLWMILAVIGFYVFGFGLQLYYVVQFNKVM